MLHLRSFIVLAVLTCLIILPTLVFLGHSQNYRGGKGLPSLQHYGDEVTFSSRVDPVSNNALDRTRNEAVHGEVIMPRLEDTEIKAELGRSSWKLLHTMTARFPEQPTDDQKEALRNFIYLFSRLYPCGECAREFQAILEIHPPQVSSREAASQWACAVHNIVNKRLRKAEFDCGQIAEKYKCGCSETDSTTVSGAQAEI